MESTEGVGEEEGRGGGGEEPVKFEWVENPVGVKFLMSPPPVFSPEHVSHLPWDEWPERDSVVETIQLLVESDMVRANKKQLLEWERLFTYWDNGYKVTKRRKEKDKKGEAVVTTLVVPPASMEASIELPRDVVSRSTHLQVGKCEGEREGEKEFMPECITHQGWTKKDLRKSERGRNAKRELMEAALCDATLEDGDFVIFLSALTPPLVGMGEKERRMKIGLGRCLKKHSGRKSWVQVHFYRQSNGNPNGMWQPGYRRGKGLVPWKGRITRKSILLILNDAAHFTKGNSKRGRSVWGKKVLNAHGKRALGEIPTSPYLYQVGGKGSKKASSGLVLRDEGREPNTSPPTSYCYNDKGEEEGEEEGRSQEEEEGEEMVDVNESSEDEEWCGSESDDEEERDQIEESSGSNNMEIGSSKERPFQLVNESSMLEQVKLVERLEKRGPDQEILIELPGFEEYEQISRHDLNSTMGENDVNDNIINAFLEVLVQTHQRKQGGRGLLLGSILHSIHFSYGK